MYRFSVVVPLLGDISLFEDTLASVLRHRPIGCQVIAAHDGTYTDPHGLADEIDFVANAQTNNLIQLFNAGVQSARGSVVGLLRPGVQLTEGWEEIVLAEFEDPNVGSVAPAIVACTQPNRMVTSGITASTSYTRKLTGVGQRLRSARSKKIQPLGPTSWSAFYRRSLLTALGDCDEQLDPHYLDLDLALSLHSLNFDCVFCPDLIVEVEEPDAIRRDAELPHGKSAQRALIRHASLAPSQRSARTVVAVLTEILGSPLRPSRLAQAIQRLGAIGLKTVDSHHRDLISLLHQQRRRLVEAATPYQPPVSMRRAA